MVARLSRPTCCAHLPPTDVVDVANAHPERILTACERIASGPFDGFPGQFDNSEILPEADPIMSGSLQQQQQQDTGRILLLEPSEGDREVLSKAARLLHPSIKSLIHNRVVKVSELR